MKPFSKFTFLCAVGAVWALAGCQQAGAPSSGQTDPQGMGTQTAGAEVLEPQAAGPDAKPGLSASNGRLVLPIVAGRPAAAYFSVRNDSAETATLAGIHVAGASTAEMHETAGGTMNAIDSVKIEPGGAIEFAPGGYHVMAFDVADDLKEGGTTELTLIFSDGDKLSMPLRVEKMGADMGGMEGMHH